MIIVWCPEHGCRTFSSAVQAIGWEEEHSLHIRQWVSKHANEELKLELKEEECETT